MSDNRVKVTTERDEWDNFQGSLFLIGIVFLIFIGVFSAFFKLFGIPEFGAVVGCIVGSIVCLKVDWMRETILEAAFIAATIGIAALALVLAVWAFK